jgi:hypothetical protein
VDARPESASGGAGAWLRTSRHRASSRLRSRSIVQACVGRCPSRPVPQIPGDGFAAAGLVGRTTVTGVPGASVRCIERQTFDQLSMSAGIKKGSTTALATSSVRMERWAATALHRSSATLPCSSLSDRSWPICACRSAGIHRLRASPRRRCATTRRPGCRTAAACECDADEAHQPAKTAVDLSTALASAEASPGWGSRPRAGRRCVGSDEARHAWPAPSRRRACRWESRARSRRSAAHAAGCA